MGPSVETPPRCRCGDTPAERPAAPSPPEIEAVERGGAGGAGGDGAPGPPMSHSPAEVADWADRLEGVVQHVSLEVEPSPGSRLARSVAASGIAQCVSASSTFPMDTVKTLVQCGRPRMDGTPGHPLGLRAALADVWRGGMGAAYAGVVAGVPRATLFGMIRVGGFPAARDAFNNLGLRVGGVASAESPSSAAHPHGSMAASALGGATMGSLAALVLHPLDVAKTLQQMGGGKGHAAMGGGPPPSVAEVLRDVVRRNGPGGIFRGCGPSMTRVALVTALQMTTYVHSKGVVAELVRAPEDAVLTKAASAFCSGMFVAVTVAPFDMLKMRMMGSPGTALEAARAILSRDGPRGFFRGTLPAAMWIVPNSILMFLTLDAISPILGLHNI